MRVEVLLIEPGLAEMMLEKNRCNRTVSQRTVDRYAAAMSRGDWSETGDSVKISSRDVLLDGQHRLMACVKSGVSFRCAVAWDVDPEAFRHIDRGKKRSIGDLVFLETRLTNSRAHASGLVRYWQLVNKKVLSGELPSESALLELVKTTSPLFAESVLAGKRVGAIIYEANAIACHYLFSEIDREAASEFFSRLRSGSGLDAGDPVLRLRERKMRKTTRIEDRDVDLALVVKAWNIRREGGRCRQLSWRRAEQFPEVSR